MADVQLSDVIDTQVYQDLEPVNSPEKTEFFQSGVITRDALLDSLAGAPGSTAELPFWNDLDADSEPNYSNDDPNDEAEPDKVVQSEQITRKAYINKGYSAMDLARELAMGDDALQHIRNRFGTYWQRQHQRRLLTASLGVLAANVANNDSDMVHDIAAESIADQSPETRWSDDAFIEAAYTMGDMVDGITAFAMNSTVAKQVTGLNGAEDVRDSEGNLLYKAYKGRRIIIDDSLPTLPGAVDGFKNVSILFGAGAWGWGEATPTTPVEFARSARAGGGGGQEELWERKTWLLHPAGYKQLGTPAQKSFTLAELSQAERWERVVERKNVPMAFLITN